MIKFPFNGIPTHIKKKCLKYAKETLEYRIQRKGLTKGTRKDRIANMYEGKIGEAVFQIFLEYHGIKFLEDQSSKEVPDSYDFLINGEKIDVKTRDFVQGRLLEIVSMVDYKPKDIYVSVLIDKRKEIVFLKGWISREDLLKKNEITNCGYGDNFSCSDRELNRMSELVERYKNVE